MLMSASRLWVSSFIHSYSVLNVLYSLMQKSKINEYMVAQREGKSAEEIAYVMFSWIRLWSYLQQ